MLHSIWHRNQAQRKNIEARLEEKQEEEQRESDSDQDAQEVRAWREQGHQEKVIQVVGADEILMKVANIELLQRRKKRTINRLN